MVKKESESNVKYEMNKGLYLLKLIENSKDTCMFCKIFIKRKIK